LQGFIVPYACGCYSSLVGVLDLLWPLKTVFAGLFAIESVVCEFVYHQYDIVAHIINKIFWLVHRIVWLLSPFGSFCCLWCQNINLPHVNIWSVNDLLLVQRFLVSLTLVLQRFGMATYLHKFLEFVHVALSVMYWMISTQVIVMHCSKEVHPSRKD
jgi:hypothetical protein